MKKYDYSEKAYRGTLPNVLDPVGSPIGPTLFVALIILLALHLLSGCTAKTTSVDPQQTVTYWTDSSGHLGPLLRLDPAANRFQVSGLAFEFHVPEQVDFRHPSTVTVEGRTVFEGGYYGTFVSGLQGSLRWHDLPDSITVSGGSLSLALADTVLAGEAVLTVASPTYPAREVRVPLSFTQSP